MTLKLHNSIPKDPYTKQLCNNDAFSLFIAGENSLDFRVISV